MLDLLELQCRLDCVSGNCFDDWGRNYLFESEGKVLETWPGRCKSNTEETVGGWIRAFLEVKKIRKFNFNEKSTGQF